MKTGLFFLFFLFSCLMVAQEFPVTRTSSPDFIIKRLDITPSLSNLSPEIPVTGKFRIREVNFDTDNKLREINITEMMEQDERMKSRTVELAPPVMVIEEKKSFSITGSNDNWSAKPHFFNQSFSPQLPSSGTRNTVYRDASESTGSSYLTRYSPFYRRYY
ncbi:hypothetical protein L1I30_13165 [Gillisia sp. M10.2A]|uniref:Uncharacterized protein n=1 Tax=Gillisia lutea TaxID=2909668 RepID=A0ABS9EID5_9FLAO|nr:hypothetical protein [Gillisia lutea]MCF4102620.1 hypothetical protein [Gillisia lutea]